MTAMGCSESCATDRSTSATRAALTESNPLVGSSRINASGRPTSSRPMLTLRISPPEIPRRVPEPMRVSATALRPSWSMTSSTRSLRSCGVTYSGSLKAAAKAPVSLYEIRKGLSLRVQQCCPTTCRCYSSDIRVKPPTFSQDTRPHLKTCHLIEHGETRLHEQIYQSRVDIGLDRVQD